MFPRLCHRRSAVSSSPNGPRPNRDTERRRVHRWLITLNLLLATVPAPTLAGVAADSPRSGARAMLEPQTGSVLIDYYEGFLRDQDIDRFRRQVAARYTEGTLGRVMESGSIPARRASVLALGLIGTYDSSNAVVARALKDSDPTVRSIAGSALWAIWFRADTPENNESLARVKALIDQERPEDAIQLATSLSARAPKFAEAYNQRAIAYFALGRFDESAADCRRALELNPFHIGALGGLALCQERLNQRREAIKTLRRALKLQPFSDGLRDHIALLEAQGEQ